MPLSALKITFLTVYAFIRVSSQNYYPILLWHSAAETCCDVEGNLYADFIKRELGQVTVKSVEMGKNKDEDFTNSLTWHPFKQINFVCDKLKQNPEFRDGYNAVGMSQGALFLRGLAQMCPYPPMKNLISLGGPHQGVDQFPRCDQRLGKQNCEIIQRKLNFKAYLPLFQISLTPATYWHDASNEENYKRGSTFLAVINNERNFNSDYVKNLQALKRMVLVKYERDISVTPNESTWFGYYDRSGREYPLERTKVYKNDTLGLQQMIQQGKLLRIESPCEHLVLKENWFRTNIIPILSEK